MHENKKLLGLGVELGKNEKRQPGQRQLSSTAARVHKSCAEMSAQDGRQKRAQHCDKMAGVQLLYDTTASYTRKNRG